MKRLLLSGRVEHKAARVFVDEAISCGRWQMGPHIKQALLNRKGPDYEAVVHAAGDIVKPLVNFENILESTWIVSGAVSIKRDMPDGTTRHISGPHGDGDAITLDVWKAKFHAATLELLSAAKSEDVFETLMTAVTKGLASLDAFVLDLAEAWNDAHPNEQPFDLTDRKHNFADRVDRWIPKITGAQFDKSGKNWSDYKFLLKLRHDFDQHPKQTSRVSSAKQLAVLGNSFATGIAGVLFDLHLLAGKKAPVNVIRAKYFSKLFYVA